MTLISKDSLDIAAARARLQNSSGRSYWRALEELAETPEFEALLLDEFPQQAQALPDKVTRRQFVTLMGASFALAGLSGCGAWRQPQETIVPYVKAPEYGVTGKPLFYATAMESSGGALGLLAETHEGRPTKAEGNPDFPATLGGTDIFAQASLLTLYDPDRSTTVLREGRIRTYNSFLSEAGQRVGVLGSGEGLRFVSRAILSPTVERLMTELLATYPNARWTIHEPAHYEGSAAGAQLAFGERVNTIYNLANADVILALDSDFLMQPGSGVRYAREFADRRRLWQTEPSAGTMNRLYAAESAYTITGSKADHRVRLKSSEIPQLAGALAAALGVGGATGSRPASVPEAWFNAVVSDLQAAGSRAVVLVGEGQDPAVHALGHAINAALGGVGSTVSYSDPIVAEPATPLPLADLVSEMNSGTVEMLVILDANPAYSAPADLNFAEAMKKVGFTIHLGLYRDETAAASTWHIPMAHYMEAWGDTRAYDGTIALVQPMIAPLYNGVSIIELLALFGENPLLTGYESLQETWTERFGDGMGGESDFNRFWRSALHNGFVADSAPPTRTLQAQAPATLPPPINGIEITFRPDPTIGDGRWANNGWLQELPKPIVKATWDNVATLSRATAATLGVDNGDLIEIIVQKRPLTVPVWITPGHADDSITLYLGYGRESAGKVGSGIGYNAYRIRPSGTPGMAAADSVQRAGAHQDLAVTQTHHRMLDRDGASILRAGTLAAFQAQPESFAAVHIPGMEEGHSENSPDDGLAHAPSLYPDYEYTGNKWAMTIDLTTCIGCNACVMACNAENNIAIVGKKEVARSREMHWLRIDTYYESTEDHPEEPVAAYHMPVPCMHCEKAPCEPVCPVAATVHDREGLNNMVYNRCVGTRYCSNNCPYKVRRFNWREYTPNEEAQPVMAMLRNPDVTVRSRGVMEKCTYCVQRISAARIEASKEGRPIADGEVLTACQSACPTRAIIFGDLNTEESQVLASKRHPLNYSMLADLGTVPRTTYLAAVRNPNPDLEG